VSDLICKPGDPGYVYPGSAEYDKHLGCSQLAAVLGFDQFGKTANDVWMEKTHRAPHTEHKRIFDRGHAMEPLMASMLAVDFGRQLKCEQIQYRHPDHPWLIYHADGMFSKWAPLNDNAKPQEGPGIWEAKAPGYHITEQMQRNGMAEGYVVQKQMGMFVASAAMGIPISWGTAGFLDYGAWELVPFDLAASPEFQENAMENIVKFWECVQSDIPPSPINPLQHKRAPVISGELEIIEDPQIRQLCVDLTAIREAKKLATDADADLIAQLKDLLEPYGAKTEVEGVMKFSNNYAKPRETIDGKGLLVYCEALVGMVNDRSDTPFESLDEIVFDRTQWVKVGESKRSLRPTIIGG